MMTGNRAMRVAVAAGQQVTANAALESAQRRAWAHFIRVVWGGPASMAASPRCCADEDRDLLGVCRRCGEHVAERTQ